MKNDQMKCPASSLKWKPWYVVGGTLASWLVRLTPERADRVGALAAGIVLCSWARHFTLTVPLSTQVWGNFISGGTIVMVTNIFHSTLCVPTALLMTVACTSFYTMYMCCKVHWQLTTLVIFEFSNHFLLPPEEGKCFLLSIYIKWHTLYTQG